MPESTESKDEKTFATLKLSSPTETNKENEQQGMKKDVE